MGIHLGTRRLAGTPERARQSNGANSRAADVRAHARECLAPNDPPAAHLVPRALADPLGRALDYLWLRAFGEGFA